MAVFYSFHYQEDSWRVQQIMNMGVVDGQHINSQKWEEVKRQGDRAIKKWIDEEMSYKSAVIVLNGRYTAGRPWVQYEIERAWDIRKPLLSIDINGLRDQHGKTDARGSDPFNCIRNYQTIFIPRFRPTGTSQQVYEEIHTCLPAWVEQGFARY